MNHGLFVVMDREAGAVAGQVMQFPSDAAARRMFRQVMQDPQQFMSKTPGDFKLCRVGVIDLRSGVVEASFEDVMTGEAAAEARGNDGL